MLNESASQAAERIHQEHRDRIKFSSLPLDRRNDLEYAYSVQEVLVNLLISENNDGIGGWKIGLTTKAMQKFAGVDFPIAGAILFSRVFSSPSYLNYSDFVRLGIEMELAIRISRDISATTELNQDNVRDFVDGVAAAFELIDDRDADYTALDASSIVADNSWNAGIVLGEAVDLDEDITLLGRQGVLTRDSEILGKGLTDDAGGDPLDMVVWLANQLQKRGHQLRAGDWVMTGSLIPTIFVKSGENYRFEIEGLPETIISIS